MTKVVVVTGASKGIGRAAALHLAAQGFYVFAGVRKTADGASLEQAAKGQITPILLDVTKQEQVAAAARQVETAVGANGLTGLVNNAGVAVSAPLEYLPLDELRAQLEVNLVGQLGVTQAFLPLLRRAKGRIINISSIGGRIAGPLLGAYHASKFALEAMTDSLRLELHSWGIEVISIEPGAVATPIWETSLNRADALIASYPPEAIALYGKAIEKKRAEAQNNSKKGIAPMQVAKVIEQALTATRPQTRYLVGPDAKIAGNIISKLPDRIKDRLLK
ncbi:MAG: SDR family oxidoreductase [Caldilineaceae bacterium]